MFKWIKERGMLLFMLSPFICAIILPIMCTIQGCVNHSDDLRQQKYERVKTAAGNDLYKIQVFCPGKTLTYVCTDVHIFSSEEVRFTDYMTGEEVNTTCPVVNYPVLRKKTISVNSDPQDLDELLKNEVVGMMDKAKTPIEQVPVVESSGKKNEKFMLDQQPQPQSQNSITINNYNK